MTVEPWQWLVFGLLLITAEMFIPTFFVLWFGVGAVLTAVIGLIVPLSLLWSVLIWLFLSLVFIGIWFKFIQPNFKNRTKAGLGASVIIGETGMVVKSPTQNNAGVVRFATPKAGASEWACRSSDVLMVGDRVQIVDIIGNELLVEKA
ncbi:NfeD family protein [Moraxella sp. VT-16-12]|uniref:NfeD family protein n=1 Tax=Moraxella sp. VT-16-12 TaxID=2014877 RepID=UPI000B7D5FD8|nr:NfeD family protein [Moraxella sp. VT-16-12]TWV80803.1 NfeD family protein [Moraxella sp. VT-16-12]